MAQSNDRPASIRHPRIVRKAVIPAAGMGTRFLPATKSMPKEMLPIVDKPVLQFVIEEAVASGIDDILIITGRGKQAIENHFDFNPELEAFLASAGKLELLEEVRDIGDQAQIHYIRQKQQLGLGDAAGTTWGTSPSPCSWGIPSSTRRRGRGRDCANCWTCTTRSNPAWWRCIGCRGSG